MYESVSVKEAWPVCVSLSKGGVALPPVGLSEEGVVCLPVSPGKGDGLKWIYA